MRFFKILGLIIMSFCFWGVSWGHDDDPSEKLKLAVSDVLSILYESDSNLDVLAKESAILNKLSEHYDLDIIIRRSIGRNWEKIELDHREQTISLIKQLVIRAYVDGMMAVSEPNVVFHEVDYMSPKRSEIATVVELDNQPINMNYRFGKMVSGWQIYDIIIENISLVATYRKQFDSFFTKSDSDALILKLKELLSNENLGQSLPL